MSVDVLENVKRNILMWFGHVERMWSERMTKIVNKSEVDRQRGRGRLRVR